MKVYKNVRLYTLFFLNEFYSLFLRKYYIEMSTSVMFMKYVQDYS